VGVCLFVFGILVGVLGTWVALRELAPRSSEEDAAVAPPGEEGAPGSGAAAAGGPRKSRRGATSGSRSHRAAAGADDSESDGTAGERSSGSSRAAARQAAPGSGGGEEPESAAAQPGLAAEPMAVGGDRSPALAAGNTASHGQPGGTGAGGLREPSQTRVALVIDDLGRSLEEIEGLRRLGVPLTYAVLPFEGQTAEVVAALRRRHEEILCHLPMEPRSGGNPGPGALRTSMSREELRAATLTALAAVPGAAGVNNHMGSGLSADAPAMATILSVIAARGLFFLDSRTSAQSVAFRLAGSLGVPAAERQVFLDDELDGEAIAAQFQRLLDIARARGEAIAIGHPHAATLAVLAAEVPRAQAAGYRFVPVSALLDRAAAPPAAAGR
jgi:uncharacterized protein